MKNEQAIGFLEKLADVSAGRYYNGEASDLKKVASSPRSFVISTAWASILTTARSTAIGTR